MGRCCAVPGCASGRKASESLGKVTLFRAPKDVELRRKWSSALDQEVRATSYICKLHFNPEDLICSVQETLKDGIIYMYEYANPHLKKKAVPKSNIINDSNYNISLLDHDYTYMYEHEKVPLKKKAVPKINIINDSNDIISLLEHDYTEIVDCSHNSVENEIINEVIEAENINSANTNFTDIANTASENDNLLVINETEKFSFRLIKEILEALPLRRNWSWTVQKKTIILFSYISSKLELVCHVKINMDLKVTVINAKTNIIFDMDVNISSITCIWELLKSLENSIFCSGTGYNDKICSDTCTGIVLPENRYKKKPVEYRCITCRKMRKLIQKRNWQTKKNEARWINYKYHYTLNRRKLI